MATKKTQANTLVKHVHQVILNIIITKDLSKILFDYIYPWGETLAYIACAIRAFYHVNIQATPSQVVFCIDLIFNLVPFIYWRVITAGKQQQLDIYNFQEKSRRVTHDYTIGDLVYVMITGI